MGVVLLFYSNTLIILIRLTLLSGNMEAEAEISVRSLLLSRINQWFVKGETESITTSIEIEYKQLQIYCRGLFSKQRYILI